MGRTPGQGTPRGSFHVKGGGMRAGSRKPETHTPRCRAWGSNPGCMPYAAKHFCRRWPFPPTKVGCLPHGLPWSWRSVNHARRAGIIQRSSLIQFSS